MAKDIIQEIWDKGPKEPTMTKAEIQAASPTPSTQETRSG